MALSLRRVAADALSLAGSHTGVVLMAVYFLVSLLQTGFVLLVATTSLPLGATGVAVPDAGAGPAPGSSLPAAVSVAAAGIAAFTGGVLTVPVRVVAVRAFAAGERDGVPEEFVFDRLGWATLHTLVVSFLVVPGLSVAWALAVGGAGYAAVTAAGGPAALVGAPLLLGGVALAALAASAVVVYVGTALAFASQFVAAADRGVVPALRGSWRLTRGDRLRVFVLIAVPSFLQGAAGGAIGLLPGPYVSNGVALAEGAVVGVLLVAVMTRAYVDLGGPTVPASDRSV